MMKNLLDRLLSPDATEIVMITQPGDLDDWRENNITVNEADYQRWQKLDKDAAALEKLLNRFRDPSDPLKLLIVTSKLLTGFDRLRSQTNQRHCRQHQRAARSIPRRDRNCSIPFSKLRSYSRRLRRTNGSTRMPQNQRSSRRICR